MAGVRLKDAPPETPFLQSNGHNLVDRTPIMARFLASNQASRPKQMQIIGLTLNKINNPNKIEGQGNSAQGGGASNLLQRISIKKNALPVSTPTPNAPSSALAAQASNAGQPLLAQIPAFRGANLTPESPA